MSKKTVASLLKRFSSHRLNKKHIGIAIRVQYLGNIIRFRFHSA